MTRVCNLLEGISARAAVEITTDSATMAPIVAESLAYSDLTLLGAAAKGS